MDREGEHLTSLNKKYESFFFTFLEFAQRFSGDQYVFFFQKKLWLPANIKCSSIILSINFRSFVLFLHKQYWRQRCDDCSKQSEVHPARVLCQLRYLKQSKVKTRGNVEPQRHPISCEKKKYSF